MEKHDILRFVGGYSLPPDLNSDAPSVREAIKRLGANVALASIRSDVFRAHFISEGILAAMGDTDTLTCKRGRKREASEIDG